MKPSRPGRRLPPLAMTAEEFDRLQAAAYGQGVNLTKFAKAVLMRAVARREALPAAAPA